MSAWLSMSLCVCVCMNISSKSAASTAVTAAWAEAEVEGEVLLLVLLLLRVKRGIGGMERGPRCACKVTLKAAFISRGTPTTKMIKWHRVANLLLYLQPITITRSRQLAFRLATFHFFASGAAARSTAHSLSLSLPL